MNFEILNKLKNQIFQKQKIYRLIVFNNKITKAIKFSFKQNQTFTNGFQ